MHIPSDRQRPAPGGTATADLSNANQRRWAIVGLLFTALLINYLDRDAISFALPLISEDFHLTPETKGLLLSCFFWSYALMQVPIGWCADHLNLRCRSFRRVVASAGAYRPCRKP